MAAAFRYAAVAASRNGAFVTSTRVVSIARAAENAGTDVVEGDGVTLGDALGEGVADGNAGVVPVHAPSAISAAATSRRSGFTRSRRSRTR
jgi:hypothetical protein